MTDQTQSKEVAQSIETNAQKLEREAGEAAVRGEVSARGLRGLSRLMSDAFTSSSVKVADFGMDLLMPQITNALHVVDTIPRDFFMQHAHPTLLQTPEYTPEKLLLAIQTKDINADSLSYAWENIRRMILLAADWLAECEKNEHAGA